jgi:phosphate transport system permease protein
VSDRAPPSIPLVDPGACSPANAHDDPTEPLPLPPPMGTGAPPGHWPREIVEHPEPVDRWFARGTLAAGVTVLVLLLLVGLFLLLRSTDAFRAVGLGFFTTDSWRVAGDSPDFGVLGLLAGTVIVGVIATTIAVPFAVCAALFIIEYASPRARRYLTGLVDLLAAIPSLLYGLWGFLFLADQIVPLSEWLTAHLGFIPFLATDPGAKLVGAMFIAGLVVSLMVLPIIASITREVFAQTPPGEREAALALGSTRWGMIRAVVFPFGRGGLVGGTMLGLGRALGETIAVSLLLPQIPQVHTKILQYGGATISGFIAARAGGSTEEVSALMAAGLVLFVSTLATNVVASMIVSRSRSGAGVDL